MLSDPATRRYISDINRRILPIGRSHRRRILDEVHAHIDDAVADRVARGHSLADATRVALSDLGPAATVAAQFLANSQPGPALHGWKRWLPVAIPAIFLGANATELIWSLHWLANGLTQGEGLVVRELLAYVAFYALIGGGAVMAVRRAEGDTTWRLVAWACSAVCLALVALTAVT